MTSTKKLTVVEWAVDKLVPYERNAKKHSDEQVKDLARLIAARGWTNPILIEKDGTIIAGHGRRLAAIALGLKKVPVIVRDDLTKVEAAALRLSDNRIVSNDYDTSLMHLDIQDLAASIDGGSLGDLLIGFSEHELQFNTVDLGAMNDEVFVEGIGDAVDDQKKANDAKVKEIDEASALPVADAIGFKRVTPDQSRRIRAFFARLETDTGKKGVEALMFFLDEFGVA